jgi:HK97 family phage prohead protease
MEKEYKSFGFEIKKTESDDEFFYFEGLCTTYGSIDRDDDRVMQGAFLESLAKNAPIVKWMHREPIGISISNEERGNGLYVKAKTPLEDSFVRDRVKPQVKIGTVRKLSIGFSATEYNYEKVEGRRWEVRNITKGTLYEYSLVDIAANNDANVIDFKSLGNNVSIFKHFINKALSNSGISQENQDKIIKSANHYISTVDNGKAFMFEDVRDISDKEGFDRFLKKSALFTKSAREYLAGLLPKRSDSDSAEIEVIANHSSNIKELTRILKGV